LNFNKNLALWVIIALLVFALFNLFQGASPQPHQASLAYSDFLTSVESGDVRDVTMKASAMSGHFRDGQIFGTYAPDDPQVMSRL